MNNETLKNQARRLFVTLNTEQNKSAIQDSVRFNRLYPIVGHAFRRYVRRINLLDTAIR
jgi:hypothetical protein